jgi:hypothetical protein
MNTVVRRVAKLEEQFGTVDSKPPILIVVSRVERRLTLDQERCIEILGECGTLPTGPAAGIVNLLEVPKGLSAKETERYLRENASEICGCRRQAHASRDSNNPQEWRLKRHPAQSGDRYRY